jgi:hypothetical protein
MITTIIILLVAFQVKHFVADYPLQTKYMLGKFKDSGWEKPLLAHAAVHAVITFVILLGFYAIVDPNNTHWRMNCFLLPIWDGACHFAMDRIKASRKFLGRFKPLTAETYLAATPKQVRGNTFFWWSIGFDQFVHHMTHYAIIYWLVSTIVK